MIQQPLDEFFQFEGEQLSVDHYRITMSVTDVMWNSLGVIHGGVMSALVDSAMCQAVAPANENGVQQAVTVEMKVNFLRPAAGQHYTADATVISRGNRLAVAECKVSDENGQLVVNATGTYYRKS